MGLQSAKPLNSSKWNRSSIYFFLQVKLLKLKEVTYIIQQEEKPLLSYPNFIKQIEWNSFPFTIKAMLYSEKRFIEHAKNLKVVLFQEEIQFHSINTLCTYFTGNTTLLTFFALSSYKKFCEHVIICIKTFFNRSALEAVVVEVSYILFCMYLLTSLHVRRSKILCVGI